MRRFCHALCLVLFTSATAMFSAAQQSVPPPTANGPSLEETMQFVHDKLMSIGSIKPNDPLPNVAWIPRWSRDSLQITDMSFDAATCHLRFTQIVTGMYDTNNPIKAVDFYSYARETTTYDVALQDVNSYKVGKDLYFHNDGVFQDRKATVQEGYGSVQRTIYLLFVSVNYPTSRIIEHKTVQESKDTETYLGL
jgi:hypothetical protein